MDNYYNQIKEKLIDNEVYKKSKDYSKNKNELQTYYDIGKLLIEAQGGERRAKYGDNLIKEYSKKLSNELKKGYTFSALTRMRKFYLLSQKVATLSQQLTWSHYVELLKFEDINKINYYISITEEQHLPVRDLRKKIKDNEYERLPNKTKKKLINKESNKIEDFIKNPIKIKSNLNYENISEKVLKRLILENIDDFLDELGDGFCYIKNEFKIKMGTTSNYIDLLLYNIKYNCYVVVELKVTELKKEHLGQIQVYMNYIDENIKDLGQNKTIGIIIVREDNKFIMKYCSDDRIFRTTFSLN